MQPTLIHALSHHAYVKHKSSFLIELNAKILIETKWQEVLHESILCPHGNHLNSVLFSGRDVKNVLIISLSR